jgi:hypothetical protein
MKDAVDVVLHRAYFDPETIRDFSIGQPFTDQIEHLLFTRC